MIGIGEVTVAGTRSSRIPLFSDPYVAASSLFRTEKMADSFSFHVSVKFEERVLTVMKIVSVQLQAFPFKTQ